MLEKAWKEPVNVGIWRKTEKCNKKDKKL